jgi:phthiocerol/phenolphthiocerol synthesis type-I polyketide synthase E
MNSNSVDTVGKIAVVGMSCRFPGCRSPQEFWKNLAEGKESLTSFSEEELRERNVDPAESNHPAFVNATGVYERTYDFDAALFGYNPREAELLDPQQRVFLESCWEALEHAGYPPSSCKGSVGLFGGAGPSNHLWLLFNEPAVMSSAGWLTVVSSNERDFLTTRVGYKLNLRGPCVTVQTACSTSLVATIMACQNLLTYQCDMAMAGGVSLDPDEAIGYRYQEGGITSPDGHNRSFDALAKGTVFTNGVGVVVLKRLEDAIADGDTIHAVVIGYGLNNDGSAKVGYTAPSVEGQAATTSQAIAMSGIDPETIGYVECHGTATPVGDPIEITALSRSFRQYTDKKQFCRVGSVKSNIGHTDSAAGIAGLIKTVLSLENEILPPSLHYTQPNPQIDFANSPFLVNGVSTEWKRNGHPRRAGVNSFGIGGTNAHVILEEAPLTEPSGPSRERQVILLSAKEQSALTDMTKRLADSLEQNPNINLADVAFTLQTGRVHFGVGQAIVCRDRNEAIDLLRGKDPTRLLIQSAETQETTTVFLFPGQGSQYPGMAFDLYQSESAFRQQVDECAAVLRSECAIDIKAILFPEAIHDNGRIHQTEFTQPALFVIEYALAKLWMSWGIQPAAMIGHSIGEYTAACLAGVLSLKDALKLVAERGRLMQQVPAGSMLSIMLTEAQVREILRDHPKLQLAAINAPDGCVVSGPTDHIEALRASLEKKNVTSSALHTSHAFHSAMMDPILEQFRRALKGVVLNAPSMPFVSNLTGKWITEEEATAPEYWVKHLRQTVRFADGLATVLGDRKCCLLEVGPGRVLSSLALRHTNKSAVAAALQSLPGPSDRPANDFQFLSTAVAKLWLQGIPLDWKGFYAAESRRRIPLPGYSLQQRTYKVAFSKDTGQVAEREVPLNLSKVANVDDWFYAPTWNRKPSILSGDVSTSSRRWLVFTNGHAVSSNLQTRLRERGDEVLTVTSGTKFQYHGSDFTIDAENPEHYAQMISLLREQGELPGILHLWNLFADQKPEVSQFDRAERALLYGFDSLLFLAKAIGPASAETITDLVVVADGVHEVTGREAIVPANAMLLGPAKVIPLEYANIQCRVIDVDPEQKSDSQETAAEQLLNEVFAESREPLVAYRGFYRWVQSFESFKVRETSKNLPVKEQGVYLVTGGLGGVGLVVAEYLALRYHAKLILFGRSAFPRRDEWTAWIDAHDANDPISRKIRILERCEDAGAEVFVGSADVSSLDQMESLVAAAKQRFGRIDGAIHSAGIPGDSVIELKTKKDTRRIIDPKVRGAIVLDWVLRGEKLDFFLLFSSLSVFFPSAGQVDYVAANAFLDSFACSKQYRAHNLPLSVNWDQWNETGMAIDSARKNQAPGTTNSQDAGPTQNGNGSRPENSLQHPVFSHWRQEGDTVIFHGQLDPAKHWMLGEHLLDGTPTLVGTAFIDMLSAAAFELFHTHDLQIRDLAFLIPLRVKLGEKRELQLVFSGSGPMRPFEFRSREKASDWITHASGRVREAESTGSDQRCDLKEMRERLQNGSMVPHGDPDGLIASGERWDNVRSARQGKGESWAQLALDDEFKKDVDDYRFHPALLDRATGFATDWASSVTGAYLPYSYDSIILFRPLTPEVFCHARYSQHSDAPAGFTTMDIDIWDQHGDLAARVKGFSLKLVEEQKMKPWDSDAAALSASNRDAASPFKPGDLGILSTEGVAAFERILSLRATSQVIVASMNITNLAKAMKLSLENGEAEEAAPEEVHGTGHPRPNLSTPYVAPRTELEESIAQVWQVVLGISDIGVYDNFADLGGHSLMAVQLASRIREVFEVDLPVARFYAQPTINGLSEAIVQVLTEDSSNEVVERALRDIQMVGT